MLFLFSMVLFTGLLSCGGDDDSSQTPSEVLFINGEIYTVNPAQPWAEAMYIKDGKIAFVGSTEDAEKEAPRNVETINLKGSMVLPGIHDVHMHPLEASTSNFQFTISTEETDAEHYLNDLEKADRQHPGDGWLLGWGHYLHTILDASRPPVEILDEVSTSRPIAIMEFTSHSIWCNSKALELMEITASTPNPTGGIIMKDADGQPNGILIDNAGNLLIDLALPVSAESEQKDYQGMVDFGLPELAKNGITSICDARTYWKRNHHKVWQRLNSEDKLTVRVNLGLWAYPNEDDDNQLAILTDLYDYDPTSLLRINQIKLYSDGIVTNTTGAMHGSYKIDLFSEASNTGLNYFSEQRIAAYIKALEPVGFDFHIHAIGDRGIHESLNAIEQSGSQDGRHRITHVEYASTTDVLRFKELNVTADCQVAGDFTNPDRWHENDDFIASELNDRIVPIRDLVNADARLTLSSDWDVSDLNPFVGIGHAVNRSPQNITLEEAIEAYTIHSAYVMRQENVVGSLEVGKEADFILLNQNLFDVDKSRISSTKVLETYLRGRRVY